jgi:diacylglycerol kinase family enzyme
MTTHATQFRTPDRHYAVVLNANAGRVTNDLVRQIRASVDDPTQVHLTTSTDHARDVLRGCLNKGVRTVFAGGGDGTIVGVINTLRKLKAREQTAIGMLRLGTGNALTRWIGNDSPIDDLKQWQQGTLHKLVYLPMIEAEGDAFPFAGAGADAAILNDYNELKTKASGRWWQPLASGITGYMIAGMLKTLPRYLRRPKVQVEVINLGAPAQRLGEAGTLIGPPIQAGDTIYRGTCTLIGAATTPLLGYGMRFFPFADKRQDRFHLRIADTSPIQSARLLPAAFKGVSGIEQVHDFHAERIRVRFKDALPYQYAGEARGYRRELLFGLSSRPTPLLTAAR